MAMAERAGEPLLAPDRVQGRSSRSFSRAFQQSYRSYGEHLGDVYVLSWSRFQPCGDVGFLYKEHCRMS